MLKLGGGGEGGGGVLNGVLGQDIGICIFWSTFSCGISIMLVFGISMKCISI